MDKETTMIILQQFFNECLRYWEHDLKVDSDTSKLAYQRAIDEIPHRYPYSPNGEEINPEWRDEFRVARLMDCYGKDWKKYAQKEVM